MCAFVKVASYTQKTEKVYSWAYLLEDNEVQQFVKCMISSTSHTHVRDLSRPIICQLDVTLIRFI